MTDNTELLKAALDRIESLKAELAKANAAPVQKGRSGGDSIGVFDGALAKGRARKTSAGLSQGRGTFDPTNATGLRKARPVDKAVRNEHVKQVADLRADAERQRQERIAKVRADRERGGMAGA